MASSVKRSWADIYKFVLTKSQRAKIEEELGRYAQEVAAAMRRLMAMPQVSDMIGGDYLKKIRSDEGLVIKPDGVWIWSPIEYRRQRVVESDFADVAQKYLVDLDDITKFALALGGDAKDVLPDVPAETKPEVTAQTETPAAEPAKFKNDLGRI